MKEYNEQDEPSPVELPVGNEVGVKHAILISWVSLISRVASWEGASRDECLRSVGTQVHASLHYPKEK